MNLVIAGGGTGGHIFGGVAIAQEFQKMYPTGKILFVGSEYGLESRLVPKAGYNLELLRVGKLVGQSLFRKLITLFQIPLSIFRCIKILRKFEASMVVGVGGFASGPCIAAARILGIPCGILEQNSVPGLTNQISGKLANKIFLAFDEVPNAFPKNKCLYTGNPSRTQLKPNQNKTDNPFTVFVFGGSQGATGINKLISEAWTKLKIKHKNIHLIHQTGERDHQWVKEKYNSDPEVEVYPFIDNMEAMYNRASLVVCRSGSGTISELGATGNAALFIPFPLAAQNHQEKNARAVENGGAAKVLIQSKTTSDDVVSVISEMINNPVHIKTMRENITKFYRPNASQQIISELAALVKS